MLLSLAAGTLLYIAGMTLWRVLPPPEWVEALTRGLFFVPPILLAASLLLSRKYTKRIGETRAAEMNEFLLRQRELAEKTAAENAAAVRRWRLLSTLYAVFLGLVAGCIAVGAGWLNDGEIDLIVYAAIVLSTALTRVRLPMTAALAKEENCLPREKFPALYALADRAAREMGCRARVRILMQTGGNVGVADYGGEAAILLGCMLLGVYGEEELYAVLLHEFAHLSGDAHKGIRRYVGWLQAGRPHHLLRYVSDWMFSYADAVTEFRYFLFDFASSIAEEAAADQAMLRCGSREAAASALVKIYYYDRFDWEQGTFDTESDYAEERPCPDSATRRLREFRGRTAERSGIWDSLLPAEILARNASHPTTKMRLDALGVSEIRVLPVTEEGAFAEERDRAIRWMDQLVLRFAETDYAEARRISYEEPLEEVRRWEAAGKPVVAEEYRDVAAALSQLGRYREAEELYLRAIDELPEPATVYALYMTGCMKLRRYDPAGIEPVYRAIEINQNYLEEGLDTIGTFCCVTGSQEELDRYRDKATELLQKQADEYSRINDLRRGDDLSAETLPDGVLDRILEYIRTVDENGIVDSVYLVRKTVSPTFFTSAFVVRFSKNAGEDARHQVMHRIFSYLDTESGWQYSLFDYEGAAAAHVERIPGSLVYQRAKE